MTPGDRDRPNTRSPPAHGLAGANVDENGSVGIVREGLDGSARMWNRNLSDAPSGSPIRCCHAPLEVICRPHWDRFREEVGIGPHDLALTLALC
jgi:hypothetical protein